MSISYILSLLTQDGITGWRDLAEAAALRQSGGRPAGGPAGPADRTIAAERGRAACGVRRTGRRGAARPRICGGAGGALVVLGRSRLPAAVECRAAHRRRAS